jgi:hypothetical protein
MTHDGMKYPASERLRLFARQTRAPSPLHALAPTRCHVPAMLQPHFSCLLRHNSDFGRSGRCVPIGRLASDHPKTRVVARIAAMRRRF